jgi:SAM-dependent methyltransferase
MSEPRRLTPPPRLILRRAELATVERYFTPPCHVLELGGGSGWQASIMTTWGCTVRSIDIRSDSSYHQVELYDGRSIPFEPASFDIVFSSNVLEHVEDLASLFPEMARVLRPGGVMIHIVPSATWRLWTLLIHYPHVVRRAWSILGKPLPLDDGTGGVVEGVSIPIAKRLKNLAWSGVHGARGNAVAELATFSRWRWRAQFAAAHLHIVDEYRTGLYYSGYKLFPRFPLETRRVLSRWLGSSCHVFVLRPSAALPR